MASAMTRSTVDCSASRSPRYCAPMPRIPAWKLILPRRRVGMGLAAARAARGVAAAMRAKSRRVSWGIEGILHQWGRGANSYAAAMLTVALRIGQRHYNGYHDGSGAA